MEKRSALTKQMEYLHARGPQPQLGRFEAGLSEELPGARRDVRFQQGPPQRGRGPVRRGRGDFHERPKGGCPGVRDSAWQDERVGES